MELLALVIGSGQIPRASIFPPILKIEVLAKAMESDYYCKTLAKTHVDDQAIESMPFCFFLYREPKDC